MLGADGTAVGRVESVLSSASGERLLIARAFSKGGYVVVARSDVASTEADGDGLTWHTLSLDGAEVASRGVFRRSLGRLMPDPFPAPYGQPRPDDEAEAELRATLRDDPLTREEEIEPRVRHGVAVLEGLIGTVGGKVVAERLARTTPGVWDALNRLHSDEELLSAVRVAVRRAGAIADAIQDVSVARGVVTVSLLSETTAAVERAEIERACRTVPGVRAVEVRIAA